MVSVKSVAYGLILAFPVFIISIKVAGSFSYLFLALIGIYFWFTEKSSPFKIVEIRLYSWIVVLHFLIMLFSIIIADEPTTSLIHTGRKIQFLLAPLVALAIYIVDPPMRILQFYIKVGTIIIGIIVISELFFTLGSNRLSGMFNPNIFGDIAVFMTLFSVSGVSRESNKEYIVSILALLFGIVAIVFSGSRGSTLLFLFLLSIYATIIWLYASKHNRRYLYIVVLALFSFFTLYSGTGASERMQKITQDIQQWESRENLKTSNGSRLEMYKSGIQAYADSPWFGYGYRNSNYVASRYVENREMQKIIYGFSHLHNTYLTHMVNAGVLGLISLLMVFLLPLKVFFGKLSNCNVFEASLMGTLLVFGYMSIGMVHSVFHEEYKNSFYLFMLAVFLIKTQKNKPRKESLC